MKPIGTLSTAEIPEDAWRSRGYHPHADAQGLVQLVTFRLADSLPRSVVERAEVETDPTRRHWFLEATLDGCRGSCLLTQEPAARIVEREILAGDGESYRLLAWVVMPNHVHVLAEMARPSSLGRVVRCWKGRSARAINTAVGREGRLWFPDYFDRFVRNADHLTAAVSYIERNPVKAGLVVHPSQWRWGSAYRRSLRAEARAPG